MTRPEAMQAVRQLVDDFSADDVKCWLASACFGRAEKHRDAGETTDGDAFGDFGRDVALVQNRGV